MSESSLLQRQLLVVTGKGGVGKSVLSAVLGRYLAARGRRTLLLEVDRRENLHQLLDIPPSGGEVAAASRTSDLYLQNLRPERVVDQVVEQKLKFGPLVERVQASPVYQRFVEGSPGLSELAILAHALRLVRGDVQDAPKVDTVVLDAPATGHGLFLLAAPAMVAQAIGQGPFADLAGEIADFVAAPQRCGMVVVTLAEEMPVQEALELGEALEADHGRRPELLVVNGLYPPLPPGDAAGDDELARLWRRRREVNEVELGRLEREWSGRLLELPMLPVDTGLELVTRLGECLAAALESDHFDAEERSDAEERGEGSWT